MGRYVATIAFALLVLVFAYMFVSYPWVEGEEPLLSKTFFWLILSICSLWLLLSVWGLIGGFIRWGKEKTEELETQDVVISKKSWHYRLSTWANGGWEPTNVKSECEYWARLFHGLSTMPFVFVIVAAFMTVVTIVGWLFSARPNVFPREDGNNNPFKSGHQPVGPVVAIMLVVGLTALFVPYSFWAGVLYIFWADVPWKVTGLIVAGVLAVVGVIMAGVVATSFLWPPLKRGASPLFAYTGARIIGRVCRTISYSG